MVAHAFENLLYCPLLFWQSDKHIISQSYVWCSGWIRYHFVRLISKNYSIYIQKPMRLRPNLLLILRRLPFWVTTLYKKETSSNLGLPVCCFSRLIILNQKHFDPEIPRFWGLSRGSSRPTHFFVSWFDQPLAISWRFHPNQMYSMGTMGTRKPLCRVPHLHSRWPSSVVKDRNLRSAKRYPPWHWQLTPLKMDWLVGSDESSFLGPSLFSRGFGCSFQGLQIYQAALGTCKDFI